MGIEEAERLARLEIQGVLDELPDDIRQALNQVSIVVRPARNSGEEELLGLFSGLTYGDGIPADPSQAPVITLFVDALWNFADEDVQAFQEECRTTLLHEIGHYLGWDEDEVESRGL